LIGLQYIKITNAALSFTVWHDREATAIITASHNLDAKSVLQDNMN